MEKARPIGTALERPREGGLACCKIRQREKRAQMRMSVASGHAKRLRVSFAARSASTLVAACLGDLRPDLAAIQIFDGHRCGWPHAAVEATAVVSRIQQFDF